MKQHWLEELNPRQLEAVTFGEGPLMVIAGAGSGKTKTLAYRVAHLISRGVSPERILLLTFTRRASKEMLNRAAQALGNDSTLTSQVWGGTFHAIANRLLRIYSKSIGLSPEFTIIDQSDAEDMLDVIRHKKIDTQKGRFPRKGTLLAIYSRRMNSGEDLEMIIRKFFPWCNRWQKELKEIFREYVNTKQNQNILDYDDLLLYWYYLLEDPATLDSISGRFDHILVDEYQDTNNRQSEILLRMRQKNRNIMVVGDDAQSIYSFRAATVHNILQFPDLFSGTHIVTLEQNYRSTLPILTTTNHLISQAKQRFTKNLFTIRVGGEIPKIITCRDEQHESEIIIEKILNHYEQGIALHDQAVLFRSSSHSASLELALIKKEIPFHKHGGLKFLDSAHLKDFLSIIRILENPKDEIAWFRILKLFEGVGPATASAIYQHYSSHNFSIDSLSTAAVAKNILMELLRFRKLLLDTSDKDRPLSSQLELINNFYLPILENNYENPQPRSNDLQHLIELASEYRSRSQFLTDLILDPPSATSDFAGKPKKDEDHLVLSTIHSAKGCEWDTVYLIHAADGCIPSDMSTESDDELEEELRLTYVAMTRAKNYLYVSWPLRFYSRPQGFSDRHSYSQCSRFFNADVLETMEKIAPVETENEQIVDPVQLQTDIRNKMKNFWE
ncbi:MAG TPA: ATP-dependent helicase [Chitinispirillaceae bacterium]|nr:ATP-dependent helicase [Chitinispirillaceae bacterium]